MALTTCIFNECFHLFAVLHKCDKLARLKLIGAQEAQVQEVLRLGGGGSTMIRASTTG